MCQQPIRARGILMPYNKITYCIDKFIFCPLTGIVKNVELILTDTHASTRILSNPDILVFAIKRFTQDPNGSLVKISYPICIQRYKKDMNFQVLF
jgi:hypothetical protein